MGATVQIKSGKVSGWERPGSIAYLGIPYAQPPKGALAFAAPQPVRSWEGTHDGGIRGATGLLHTVPGTSVPEPAYYGPNVLNLDVFTPDPREGADLPVLVWMHGGGFTMGSHASPWYDGRAFNRDGVVVVNVSYRLGFEGFGYVPERPLNRAVLDWLAALRWVQENISSFGGDPTRVTIGGQSAGGSAVLTLFATPAAQGLFRGGWAASPASIISSTSHAKSIGRQVAKKLGVPNTPAAFEATTREALYRAQTEVAEATQSGPRSVNDLREMTLPYGPVFDDALIGSPTFDAFEAGVGAGVPLVVGSTSDEFSAMGKLEALAWRTVPAPLALRWHGLSKTHRKKYEEALKTRGITDTDEVVGRLRTDAIFRSVAVEAAESRLVGSGGTAKTWVYSFDWPTPVHGLSPHCVDLPYLFDCLNDEGVPRFLGDEPPQALADDLHAAAVRFISVGDEPWPTWNVEDPVAQVFSSEPTLDAESYASAQVLLTKA